MSNNRLYLIHPATGRSLAIAKRGPVGWRSEDPNLHKKLQEFFDATGENAPDPFASQDDLALAMEDVSLANDKVVELDE